MLISLEKCSKIINDALDLCLLLKIRGVHVRKLLKSILIIAVILLAIPSCNIKMPYQNSGIVGNVVEKDYEVLGPVSISGKHHNVLGIIGWGGIGYNDLLDKAKELYPEADAVINIIEDVSSFSVAIFYNNFGVDMSGLAIRYIDNTEDYSVNFTVNTSE